MLIDKTFNLNNVFNLKQEGEKGGSGCKIYQTFSLSLTVWQNKLAFVPSKFCSG
jgi:hypothetical protein